MKKKTPNPDSMPDVTKKNFLVVGIGASAGGIKALKEFFSNVAKDSGNAYVVILHLSPECESKLAEILQTTAPIPVEQVRDEKVKVKPDCVYVIPPNKSLSMLDGHLATSPISTHEERRAPVDVFFRTLAESQKTRAVSVVLSGTGPDGSMGIKRVKEKGGIVIAQDPREAEYADMPRNTIATGLVDAVLPAVDIPAKISEYKNQLGTVQIPDEREETEDEKGETALREVFTHLRVRTGHDFTNYKRATILRRIERRMNVHSVKDLPGYARKLRETPEETQALLKDLLISVTNFFRDREAFEKLDREVIPRILEKKGANDSARIWVAGCATGEEAYSLAMLFAEQTEKNINAPGVQIFATDIDEAAIAQARGGLYTNSDVADVSPERLRRFFTKEGEDYRVRRELRETILFANHNVTKDPPFSHLDLVTCRNLLIYLNRIAQKRVMETAHFALEPDGFLFLGNSESIEDSSDLFVAFDKENRIFQSRSVAARLSIPVPNLSPKLFANPQQTTLEQRRTEEIRALERLSYTALHQQLLEQYAPPSIIVNDEYNVIHISENAGRFLQITGGEPSTNLLRIARAELRLDLRSALYQAAQKRLPVTVTNVQVRTDESVERINIIVRPVIAPGDTKRGYILVIFEPSNRQAEAKPEVVSDLEPIARQLEEELARTKAQLRATVEQYEIQHEELKASNEELQAINEELRSASEELETSKEELQSVNEELHTVNQELKIKIEELSESNSDFQNLLNSTDIGTIFLDRNLRIKRYTSPAADIFNITPSDVGRPLEHFTNSLEYVDLTNDARQVLRALSPIEREVVDKRRNRTFLARVLPYRTMDDRIEGVVLNLLDITERKQAEEAKYFLASIVESSEDSMITTNFDGKITSWNRAAEKLYGYPANEAIGKPLTMLTLPEDLKQVLNNTEKIKHSQKVEIYDTVRVHKNGRELNLEIVLSPVKNPRGQVIGVSTIARNVSERKMSEDQIRKSEEQLHLILESAADYAIFTQNNDGIITRWYKGAENIFGYTEAEAVGKNVAIIFTAEDRAAGAHIEEMQTALRAGRAEDERWHVRKDGSRFYASGILTAMRNGGIEGFVKIARDRTEARVAETTIRDKEMLQQLVVMQEEERRRIARDIHDHLGQQMTALRLKLDSIKSMCDDNVICREIEETQKVAEQLDADVDFIAWELRPVSLDDLGLRATIANFVNEWSRHSKVEAEFHASGLSRTKFAYEIETNLYRIAQEALNNIYKHAEAKSVSVLLERRKDKVVLIIEDDGKGFNVRNKMARGKGLGLSGMMERAKILGGELEIESAPKKGTTVYARIPLVIRQGNE